MTALHTDTLTLRAPAPGDIDTYVAFYTSDRRARTGKLIDADSAATPLNAPEPHVVFRHRPFADGIPTFYRRHDLTKEDAQ